MTCPLCSYYVSPSANAWRAHFRYAHLEIDPLPFPLAGSTQESSSPMQTFEQTFAKIFQEAFDLLVTRQHKYGPENIRQLGIFGVFGRLADDKIERIRRGMNGKIEHGKVVIDDFSDFGDESFEDALLDIANYALILLALKRGEWGKPLDKERKRLVLASEMALDEQTTEDPPPYPLEGLNGFTVEPSWIKELMSNFSIASEEEEYMVAGTD